MSWRTLVEGPRQSSYRLKFIYSENSFLRYLNNSGSVRLVYCTYVIDACKFLYSLNNQKENILMTSMGLFLLFYLTKISSRFSSQIIFLFSFCY